MSANKRSHFWYLYILIIALTGVVNVNAQSYSQVIFDKNLSEHFGAQNMSTLHRALYSFEDRLIRDTLFYENTIVKKGAGIGYRFAKLVLLDQQVDRFISLSQHEVFGHGARFREFGYENSSYNMNLSWPYGSGRGFASAINPINGLSAQERTVVNMGGVEANLLLAQNITHQVLLDDKMHYRQGLLFGFAQNNLFRYLWKTQKQGAVNTIPGNDMNNYVSNMNFMYYNGTGETYSVKELSNQSFIAFANPIQLYSLYSLVYTYGIMGRKEMKKLPMIRISNIRYLPALNYALTPFGSEYHFVNYVRYKEALFSADFSLGDNTFNTFYGASIKGFNIVNRKRITLNFHLDIWNQPELELEKYGPGNKENKVGEALKADILFRPFERENKLGLFLQLGYKTKGYVIGEALDESYIVRLGLSMHL